MICDNDYNNINKINSDNIYRKSIMWITDYMT